MYVRFVCMYDMYFMYAFVYVVYVCMYGMYVCNVGYVG